MHKAFEITLYVLIPLVWGLGVEFAFELIRRRRAGRAGRGSDA